MATSIFASQEGAITLVSSSTGNTNAQSGLISIGDSTNKTTFPALIMDLDVLFETSQNWTRALDDTLYVLPFGDRPIEISIDCLVMPSDCASSDGEEGQKGVSENTEKLLDFYLEKRIKRDSVAPITIMFANKEIIGFLVKFKVNAASSANNMPITRATFNILGWFKNE